MSVARQFLRSATEDPRHVDGDVAHPDHGHPLVREIELGFAVVGMAVVPADELRGGMAALQVLAGDAHPTVGLGARGVEDLVVVAAQILHAHVLAQLDPAEEPEAGQGGHLVEGGRDRLDLLVIGGHAAAHQAERGGQPIEHVDLDREVRLAEQLLRGIEPGGPCPDDRHA